MLTRCRALLVSLVTGVAMTPVPSAAAADFITVASTTSTENSGLFGHILPLFTHQTGIAVRVLAQGTGQALETGRRGDADVVLVHARAQEEAFVAEGWGVERRDVMYNDFIIVGPADDPADVATAETARAAMTAIAGSEAAFVSRGDDSGTHVAEMALWAAADIEPMGSWYVSTGSGMGATLNIAAQVPGYALTDRATWLSFANRGPLGILVQGDPVLSNAYGAILVNPKRHPHVKAAEGQTFIDWLVSDAGRQAIGDFTIEGEQLFFPHAP